VKHISDGDLVKILTTIFFGSGADAFKYLNTVYDTPMRRQDLRELDMKWIDTNIVSDVGIGEDTIMNFAKLLTRMNGERPAACRHSNDELTEKLLESIADSSRHFHELAMTEYNALPGTRKFELPAGQPYAGSRDFLSCVEHYHRLWRSAVRSRVLTPMLPQRRVSSPNASKPSPSGMLEANTVKNYGGSHYSPTRSRNSTSPSRSLYLLRQAGLKLDRGTSTTTNFSDFSSDEIAMAVVGGRAEGFDVETCHDADSRRSIDVICDCCRGVGHVRRQCPSPKVYRSFGYVIKLLELAKHRSGQRGGPIKDSMNGKRTVTWGQRPQSRVQPSRFQSSPWKARPGFEGSRSGGEQVRNSSAKLADEHVVKTIATECEAQGMPISLAQ